VTEIAVVPAEEHEIIDRHRIACLATAAMRCFASDSAACTAALAQGNLSKER
jgi:hypothetical protein